MNKEEAIKNMDTIKVLEDKKNDIMVYTVEEVNPIQEKLKAVIEKAMEETGSENPPVSEEEKKLKAELDKKTRILKKKQAEYDKLNKPETKLNNILKEARKKGYDEIVEDCKEALKQTAEVRKIQKIEKGNEEKIRSIIGMSFNNMADTPVGSLLACYVMLGELSKEKAATLFKKASNDKKFQFPKMPEEIVNTWTDYFKLKKIDNLHLFSNGRTLRFALGLYTQDGKIAFPSLQDTGIQTVFERHFVNKDFLIY